MSLCHGCFCPEDLPLYPPPLDASSPCPLCYLCQSLPRERVDSHFSLSRPPGLAPADLLPVELGTVLRSDSEWISVILSRVDVSLSLWSKCLCPPQILMVKLQPQCGGMRRWSALEGRGLMNGISAFIKATQRAALMLPPCEDPVSRVHLWTRKQTYVILPDTEFAYIFILNCQASRTVRNEFVVYKHSVYGILLHKLKWTGTLTVDRSKCAFLKISSVYT